MIVYIFDNNGFYNNVCATLDANIQSQYANQYTEIAPNTNFFRNKWNGTQWVEDATLEEINAQPKSIQDLLLYKLLRFQISDFEQLQQIDFTLLGLTTETPKYGVKGVKSYSDYTLNGQLAVKKEFNYTDLGLELKFNYYLNDGTVGFVKTEFKPLDKVELGKIFISNRARTIAYLQTSAIGTPIENGVNALLKRYFTEVGLFVQNNTNDFINALNNESNASFLNLLNTDLRQGIAPIFTVKQSILKQIS